MQKSGQKPKFPVKTVVFCSCRVVNSRFKGWHFQIQNSAYPDPSVREMRRAENIRRQFIEIIIGCLNPNSFFTRKN